ncbi:AraC-type DNA-binding protein [Lampropedia hyalina DSM 16112]|uniref:AraC-type DNA-binding protein n=1 Tax=Lampropedia hyalina DSM 16112 TaxID=1122156 RepID=A0A1M4UPF8_9BURK|nr:helix-turn-helix transcriptional regulator [Lampropedia hyalina]SHE58538.1 AraC-type DNA-binding protein [Lampropedia hyalina DSM 16112]
MEKHDTLTDCPSVLEQYDYFYGECVDFVEPESGHAPWRSAARPKIDYRVRPTCGRGWTDIHELDNGVLVGRMDWCIARTLDVQCQVFPDTLSLGLMVQGRSRTILSSGQDWMSLEGDLMVRHADPGPVVRAVEAGCHTSGVSVDIPAAMLETLHEQGVNLSCIGGRGTYGGIRPSPDMVSGLRGIGQRMLALRAQHSLLARLELESLGLDILLKLLACSTASASVSCSRAHTATRWQTALDGVLDILHAEWNRPLTIAQLARRAGMNELYLKTLFRERTGQTVAAYLRHLRMQHARAMLAAGNCTVQMVAHHCGYAHAGKFAQAFRRVHGLAPSEVA